MRNFTSGRGLFANRVVRAEIARGQTGNAIAGDESKKRAFSRRLSLMDIAEGRVRAIPLPEVAERLMARVASN